jgi:hypothetical protein
MRRRQAIQQAEIDGGSFRLFVRDRRAFGLSVVQGYPRPVDYANLSATCRSWW